MQAFPFQKVLIVVHPISANKLFATFEDDFEDFCFEHNIICLRYNTTGEGDQLKLRELFYDEKPDVIVAAGGDGTVNLCGNVVAGTSTPIAIIPVGSTNGLAKELNIPLTTTAALNLLITGRAKSIDTLALNGRLSFHISDLGFNARILKRVSKSSVRGRIFYFLYSLNEFFRYKPSKYEVTTPDRYFKGKALMIIITNSRGFGYNLIINPGGIIDDGIFEICIIKRFPRIHVFKMLYRVYSKTIHKSRYAKIIKATRATILNLKSEEVHIDGEPVEMEEKISVEINPGSLNILVP
jgi:diacylglycerol kinase (ATP)